MESLGHTLKSTREQKRISASDAARSTRIKVQHIEAIERDDFSQIAAPAYAKGFIKIYAEYLGLDPEPLIKEYLEKHAPKERPPLLEEEPEERPGRTWTRPSIPWREIWERVRALYGAINWSAFKRWPWPKRPPRVMALYVAIAVFLLLVLMGITRFVRRERPDVEERPVRPVPEAEYPLIRDVPDPYLEKKHESTE